MPFISLVLLFFLVAILVLGFCYWGGGRIQKKFEDFPRGEKIQFKGVCAVFLKQDPYQFIYRIYKPTSILISETEVLLIGKNRIFAFITYMMNVSERVQKSELQSEVVSEGVLEFTYTNEGGFKTTLRVLSSEYRKIMECINP